MTHEVGTGLEATGDFDGPDTSIVLKFITGPVSTTSSCGRGSDDTTFIDLEPCRAFTTEAIAGITSAVGELSFDGAFVTSNPL